MTALNEIILQSIKDEPRDIYELARTVCLFIPRGSKLEGVAKSVMESLAFAPKEMAALHFRNLLFALSEEQGEEPRTWWAMVIAVIVGGGGAQQKFIDVLDSKFAACDESGLQSPK